jgi:hypothetical protein
LSRFFICLVLAAVVLTLSVWLFEHWQWISHPPTFMAETLLLLLAGTGVIFVYLNRVKKDLFTPFYLTSIVLKLIAYSAFNLAIVLKDPAHAKGNVVFFLITYIVFTTLEIGFLYRKINF